MSQGNGKHDVGFNFAGRKTGLFSPSRDNLALATKDVTRLHITQDGRVGLGTDTPSALLHLATGDLLCSLGGQIKGSKDASETKPAFSWQDDIDTGLYRAAPDTVGLTTGGAERMRVASDGKVGIGTKDPREALHVEGTVRAPVVLAGKLILTPGVK